MLNWRAESGAGIDGLRPQDGAIPEPGHSEVLVEVRAASLSRRELMVLDGTYVLPVKPDLIPVSDGAGVVVAVGAGVTGFTLGDRVTANLFPDWQGGPCAPELAAQLGRSLDGWLGERVVLPAAALVHVPPHLSFAEAATLPCAAVTAWNALDGLGPGQSVLTLGTGGVSLFAAQLAIGRGARVIATTGSPAKAARLQDLGIADVVDRNDAHWPDRVRELTGGRGVDRVVEVAGSLGPALAATAVAGQVAFVGFLDGALAPLDPMVLFRSVATVRTIAVGSRADFNALNRAIATTGLRPVIDHVFALTEADNAYRYFAAANPFGKVVIQADPDVR